MKGIARRTIATVMALVMTAIMPLANAAPKAAAEDKPLYISELKVGMGETEAEAKKELEAEGYTILKDDNGNYADLNADAGSKSALKRGANDKIVYLGYKTTDDPEDAVTDLALMNMEGGFSIDDYNKMMDEQMESQIKPFVDRFISTLEEYRTNYKKSKSSKNYKRANYVRQMLNKLTDDDTGGQPMGDLLLNKTKYEMGDDAYNKLSDAEKKKHADILTILMQANGKATLTIETLITKATDTGKNSWVDRFSNTTLDDLIKRIEDEDESLNSRSDVLSALDRRYNDTAKELLGKWKYFQKNISEYEDKADDILDNGEDVSELTEEVSECDYGELIEESVKDDSISDDEQEAMDNLTDANDQVFDQAIDVQFVAIGAYLESVDYDDGTMLEFFEQDYDEVSDTNGIRKLYPIVDALTDGQIAGLEFLSFTDLFQIALSDENTYKDVCELTGDIEKTSIYENVDRAIYEKGLVALTSKALRAKARDSKADNGGYKPSALTIAMWGVTVGFAAATVATKVVSKFMTTSPSIPTQIKNIPLEYKGIWSNIDKLKTANANLNADYTALVNDRVGFGGMAERYTQMEQFESKMQALDGRIEELNKVQNTGKTGGSIASKLAVGMAIVTVILTIFSTVMTILEAQAYYRTVYIPIPQYMVEEADITTYNAKGEKVMKKNQTAYYKVVKCNRTEGNNEITKDNYRIMGDSNDLKGDIGKEWLALYAVKYLGGAPILADSLKYIKDSKTVPEGYTTGIHEFGGTSATNLNNKHYVFPDDPPSIKVFYKTATSTVSQLTGAGSIFGAGSGGSLALGGGVGLIAGVLLGLFIAGRRKKQSI